MAIYRHNDEWKRTIFIALAAGVTFEQHELPRSANIRPLTRWIAFTPAGAQHSALSKYMAARAALHDMEKE